MASEVDTDPAVAMGVSLTALRVGGRTITVSESVVPSFAVKVNGAWEPAEVGLAGVREVGCSSRQPTVLRVRRFGEGQLITDVGVCPNGEVMPRSVSSGVLSICTSAARRSLFAVTVNSAVPAALQLPAMSTARSDTTSVPLATGRRDDTGQGST